MIRELIFEKSAKAQMAADILDGQDMHTRYTHTDTQKVAKMRRLPQVAGHFPQKSHYYRALLRKMTSVLTATRIIAMALQT